MDTNVKKLNMDAPDRTGLYRSIALVLIGFGAMLGGAGGIPTAAWIDAFGLISLPLSVCLLLGLATLGVYINGAAGMAIFAAAFALIGGAVLGSAIPVWLYVMGLPCLMLGIALRIFNRP